MRARAFDGRGGAFDEMFDRLGLDLFSFQKSDSKGRLHTPHLFLFPGGDGCWLSYLPDVHSLVDLPF